MVWSDMSAETDPLPFVAPCRPVAAGAPLRWVRLGWRDLTAAPLESLAFGAGISALSALVCAVALRFGTGWLVLVLLSGFVFVAPVLAIGLYAISAALEWGIRPSFANCLAATRRHVGDALVYSLILMVICLVWVRAGSMVEVFFPEEAVPSRLALATFLAIGSAVGSLFAIVVFAASAFSLPMFVDRRTDAVTAVPSSGLSSLNTIVDADGPGARARAAPDECPWIISGGVARRVIRE
jgi:uncharacterized membrane protein